jgi:hypothetical protein
VSIIIRLPLITMRPRIIIIKLPFIMILASTKRRRITLKRLTNIASRDTSTPRPLANILRNDGHWKEAAVSSPFAHADPPPFEERLLACQSPPLITRFRQRGPWGAKRFRLGKNGARVDRGASTAR